MKEQTAKWIKQAQYDLKTAEAMLRTKRYVYVVFLCHLSIEKMLKAIITEITEDYPPRIHSLEKLAQVGQVIFPGKMQEFIRAMSEMSIPTRYIEEVRNIARDQAQETMSQTRKVFRWLKDQIK